MRSRSMKVGDLGVRKVATVTGETPLREAAKQMRRDHVGSLVVIDSERRPVGMLTDRDITVEVIALDRNVDELTVAQVMSKPVVKTEEDESVTLALSRMREFGIRRLPIVDAEGRLCGVLTNSNLIEEISVMLDSLVRNIKASKTREEEMRQ